MLCCVGCQVRRVRICIFTFYRHFRHFSARLQQPPSVFFSLSFDCICTPNRLRRQETVTDVRRQEVVGECVHETNAEFINPALFDSSGNSSEMRSDVCVHFVNSAFQSIASAMHWAKVFDSNWSIECCCCCCYCFYFASFCPHTARVHTQMNQKSANQSFRQSICQRLRRGAHANACDLSETVSDRTNNQQIWNDFQMNARKRERESEKESGKNQWKRNEFVLIKFLRN